VAWTCLATTGVLPAGAAAGARAVYAGGTLSALQTNTSGRLLLGDQEALLFVAGRGMVRVRFSDVNLLEYGQQASRRYALALALSPLLLLSKSRRHFLTVGFQDAQGRQQAMVLRIDKNDVRAVLAGLEARTGLKVEYQIDRGRLAGVD